MNRIPGSTIVGQNSGETVWSQSLISHAGSSRVEPSRKPTYQSGCEPALTWDGLYGPYSQTGLICTSPPSSAIAPKTSAKNPPALAP